MELLCSSTCGKTYGTIRQNILAKGILPQYAANFINYFAFVRYTFMQMIAIEPAFGSILYTDYE